jgi:indole-3-glycerol phosphate synthase
MSILDEIVAYKREEVAEDKELRPVKLLEQSIHFLAPCVSLKAYLDRRDLVGVIAEFKRKSPSLGFINQYASVEKTTLGYMQSGASALSILTDKKYFGGSIGDLTSARRVNYCPILRKDFIVDEYQIIEAKSAGADVILLIASVLSDSEISALNEVAEGLGLEVLLEVHSHEEIVRANNLDPMLVGINSRNLNDFSVDLSKTAELAQKLSDEKCKIAESGIRDPKALMWLKEAGFKGFLIGEAFMRNSNPVEVCSQFIKGCTSADELVP